MPDSAEQLQRLYLAGFELQTFERFPKCIGVMRDNCVALLVPGVDGLQILGTPGWRMGEVMGVLTEREGRQSLSGEERSCGGHAGAAGRTSEVPPRPCGIDEWGVMPRSSESHQHPSVMRSLAY